MKLEIATIALAVTMAGAVSPALARDALPAAAAQTIKLTDGSTLYVFKDGKMAKEDKFGRPTLLKNGEVLETSDGRKMTVTGNEVQRLDGLIKDGHRN